MLPIYSNKQSMFTLYLCFVCKHTKFNQIGHLHNVLHRRQSFPAQSEYLAGYWVAGRTNADKWIFFVRDWVIESWFILDVFDYYLCLLTLWLLIGRFLVFTFTSSNRGRFGIRSIACWGRYFTFSQNRSQLQLRWRRISNVLVVRRLAVLGWSGEFALNHAYPWRLHRT